MIEEQLKNIWYELSIKYMDVNYSNELWDDISNRYNSNKRVYHNLSHLYKMVEFYIKYKGFIINKDEILFAIFYHDIIYKIRKNNNEFMSAVHMENKLYKTKLQHMSITLIHDAILATKTHELNTNNDINFLLDFDMVILGSDRDDYNIYCNQIRNEYKFFPTKIYNLNRKKALKKFIKNDIFKTSIFKNRYEQIAIDNINSEITYYDTK